MSLKITRTEKGEPCTCSLSEQFCWNPKELPSSGLCRIQCMMRAWLCLPPPPPQLCNPQEWNKRQRLPPAVDAAEGYLHDIRWRGGKHSHTQNIDPITNIRDQSIFLNLWNKAPPDEVLRGADPCLTSSERSPDFHIPRFLLSGPQNCVGISGTAQIRFRHCLAQVLSGPHNSPKSWET